MTTQAEIRAGLVTVLQGVSGLRRVYPYPPATVQDVPCAIVISADVEEQWGASMATVDWTWRIVVLCRDAQLDTAVEDAEDFRDDFRLALRQAIKLGGLSAVAVTGSSFTETQPYQWGGEFIGFDATVPIKVSESVEFAI
jgi:hypothetical protein